MAEKEKIQDEQYSGAEFDTIDVPEDTKTVLSDQDAAHDDSKDEQQETQKPEQLEQQPDTKEQRQQRKRNDYQKRLNELVRQKHEAEERAAAAEAKAELLEQRRIDAEKGASESTAAILKQREQELIERRRQAEEEGNLAESNRATDELFAVRDRMRPKTTEPERVTEQRVQGEPEGMIPEAAAWLESNQWYTDPGNSHLSAEVQRIELSLILRGYSLKNPEQAKKLYAEIDRRIRELPEFDSVLGVEEIEEQEVTEVPEKTPAPRNHIAPPSRGGEAPPRKKAGELTDYDIRTMKQYGLDHKDPKVREAYLKRKRA